MASNDREIRLSVTTLRQLLEDAESECYILVTDNRGEWVRVTPFVPEQESAA